MRGIPKIPIVLVIAGNDPSGGAGICADIQAISALDCHPAPVITVLTVQDTCNAYRVEPLDPNGIVEQANAVLQDMPVAAIKLGLLGNAEIGMAVSSILEKHRGIPVIIDPVLIATGGASLAESDLVEVYLEHLLQHATVLTPNEFEITQLGYPETGRTAQATILLNRGCEFVLAKGGDDPTPDITNLLIGPGTQVEEFTWPRLPGSFHGSGCTLSSALAAYVARGEDVAAAARLAQAYTSRAIQHGWQPGKGQHIPNRMHSE